MRKTFNVSGNCYPELHYMVDLSDRLLEIKKMVDAGQYFTINRARQYGKTKSVRILLGESNPLFDSLVNKLEDYPELDKMLRELLFKGKEIPYVIGIRSIEMALMFGFVKVRDHLVCVANRIFETLLYNLFLASPDIQQDRIYDAAVKDKNLFIENGQLNMKRILERFVVHLTLFMAIKGKNSMRKMGVKEVVLRDKVLVEAVV